MRAILDFNGWKKEILLTTTEIRTGRVRACMYEPIILTRLRNSNQVTSDSARYYTFTYYGQKEGEPCIFKCSG